MLPVRHASLVVSALMVVLGWGCAEVVPPAPEREVADSAEIESGSSLARADADGYRMRIFTPDPSRRYHILHVKPDPGVDFKMRVIPPAGGMKRPALPETSEKLLPRRRILPGR